MATTINLLDLPTAERIDLYGTRYYKYGELSGPSVTTVLKDSWAPDLADWHARCAVREALELREQIPPPSLLTERADWTRQIVAETEGAADRIATWHAAVGEIFHDYMWSGELDDLLVQQLPPDYAKYLSNLTRTWPEVLANWEIYPLLTEFQTIGIVPEEFVYGGTLDAVVEDESGYRALLEVKTSRSLSPSHAVQAAAYEHALSTMHAVHVDGVYVLRLDKYQAGKYDLWEVDLKKSFRFFEDSIRKYNLAEEVWIEMRG